jgi:hypothetical protein
MYAPSPYGRASHRICILWVCYDLLPNTVRSSTARHMEPFYVFVGWADWLPGHLVKQQAADKFQRRLNKAQRYAQRVPL